MKPVAAVVLVPSAALVVLALTALYAILAVALFPIGILLVLTVTTRSVARTVALMLHDIAPEDLPLAPGEQLPDPMTQLWLEDLEREGRALVGKPLPREAH